MLPKYMGDTREIPQKLHRAKTNQRGLRNRCSVLVDVTWMVNANLKSM